MNCLVFVSFRYICDDSPKGEALAVVGEGCWLSADAIALLLCLLVALFGTLVILECFVDGMPESEYGDCGDDAYHCRCSL